MPGSERQSSLGAVVDDGPALRAGVVVQGVRARRAGIHDVLDPVAASEQHVGEQRAMAVRGIGLGTQDRGAPAGRQCQELRDTARELVARHVVGVAAERAVRERRVRRAGARLAQAAQLGDVCVRDARFAQRARECRSRKVWMASRGGMAAYIRDRLDVVRGKQREEVLEGAVGMAYGEEMHPGSNLRSVGWRVPALVIIALSLAPCAAGCGAPRPSADAALREPLGPSDPFTPRTAALLWPGATNAFLLTDRLRLSAGTFAVEWHGEFEGEPMPEGRFGRPRAGSPVVVWLARGERAVWRATLVPVPVEDADATRLAASVELTVQPLAGARGRARLACAIAPDSSFPVPAGGDATPLALAWRRTRDGVPPVLGPASADGAVLDLSTGAEPSRPARWRFLIAGSPRLATRLGELARQPHAARLAAAEQQWANTLAGSTRLSVGDPALEQAVDEALLALVGCTERDGLALRGIGNPFQYRDTWIRDAARQASALSQWGLAAPASAIAADLAGFQGAAGDLMSQPGQLDGTGQAMWAQAEVFSRGTGTAVPDSIASMLARAWRWCERERSLVRERVPAYAGLMPPADPRDNELTAGYLFGTDAWTLAGYRSAATLLERAGASASADSIRRSADAYADVLSARIARERGMIPACWSGPARDWGNYAALMPTGAISLAEAGHAGLLSNLSRVAEASGLATYATEDTVHLYLGSDLAVDALLMGRAPAWRKAFGSCLAARTGTGGLPELFSWSTHGFGGNLPPHATAAAALLVLLRQGLAFDALGDTLRLTLGTLGEWWQAGASLERAPTRWGVVDLAFHLDGARASWRWTPVPVWTELTLPPDRVVDAVPDGVRRKDAYRLLVPPGRGEVEVTCRAE